MASKTIKMNLFDPDSVNKAIKRIEKYRKNLIKKTELLCKRLAEEGVRVADAAINSVPIGKTITLTTDINPSKMGCQAIIKMTGRETRTEDGRTFYTALAIEFGAGIYYNKTANPKSSEFGMGVGTFPDQSHAFDPNGWYYLDSNGEWKHSYGVQASMPMYKASVEMRKKIDSIVKEVFG